MRCERAFVASETIVIVLKERIARTCVVVRMLYFSDNPPATDRTHMSAFR